MRSWRKSLRQTGRIRQAGPPGDAAREAEARPDQARAGAANLLAPNQRARLSAPRAAVHGAREAAAAGLMTALRSQCHALGPLTGGGAGGSSHIIPHDVSPF